MQAEWFEEFAQKLLDEKGVNLPDEEVKNQLIKDISVRARDVVLARLLEDMSDDELQKLELATDSGDTATADGIIARHQTVITTTLAEFKGMYLRKK